LEKEYPHLAEKAKKWLGYEFYYDLSVATHHGEPLYITHYDHYKVIMKKQDEIKKLIKGHYKDHIDQRVDKLHLPQYKDEKKQHVELPPTEDEV